jgi:hypothetical protein
MMKDEKRRQISHALIAINTLALMIAELKQEKNMLFENYKNHRLKNKCVFYVD